MDEVPENQRQRRRNARSAATTVAGAAPDVAPPGFGTLPTPLPPVDTPAPIVSERPVPPHAPPPSDAPLGYPNPSQHQPPPPLGEQVLPPPSHPPPPLAPLRGVTAAVPLCGPVLAVRLDCIDGVAADPYVVKPVVRVHIVDGRTGRYLCPAALVAPPPASLSIPGATRRSPPAPPPDASTHSSCFPRPASAATSHATSPTAHVAPLCSVPALNCTLDADVTALHGAQKAQISGASAAHAITPDAGSLPPPTEGRAARVLPTHLGPGHATPSLLFNDILVFDVAADDAALLAHAIALFELVDDSPSLPAEARREGNGYYRIAWGFLRLSSVLPPIAADGPVPVGLPSELLRPVERKEVGAQQAPEDLPALRVALHRFRGSAAHGWATQLAGRLSGSPVRPVDDGSGVPAPDVVAEFLAPAHLREDAPGGLSLRAVPFPAAIPQVRFVFSTLAAGTAYTFLEPTGMGLQHTIALPHVPHPGVAAEAFSQTASAKFQIAALLAHPALGRPGYMASLPTDVYVSAPVKVAVRQQALHRAPSAKEVKPPETQTKALRLGRYHRAPADPCLVPETFIASLPTGRLGAMCVAFSPNGALIAAGCADDVQYPVRVFSTEPGYAEVARLRGHGNIVYAVSWSADSRWLVSASGDGRCFIWRVVHSVAGLASASLLHPSPHAVLRHSPPSYVYAARFHPLAPSLVVTGAYDHGVRLWDARLPPAATTAAEDAAAEDSTTALVVDPTRAALSATVLEGALLGFIGAEPGGGGPAATPRGNGFAEDSRLRHAGFVKSVEFDAPPPPAPHAPAGVFRSGSPRRLFTADSMGVILVWTVRGDAPHRPEAYTLLREMRPGIFRGVPIVAVRVRPGADQLLAVGHSNVVRLFDLTTYAPVRGFAGARCAASRVDATFSPDGRFIAAGSEDGVLTLWDADTGTPLPAQASVSEGGRRTDIAFPSGMFGVSWHPSQHVVAVSAFGGAFPVMLCGTASRPHAPAAPAPSGAAAPLQK